MLNFYHIRQEFRFKPGLKLDQTGGSGSGSALILNQTGGSVSGSAKKVPNWTKPNFGNTNSTAMVGSKIHPCALLDLPQFLEEIQPVSRMVLFKFSWFLVFWSYRTCKMNRMWNRK